MKKTGRMVVWSVGMVAIAGTVSHLSTLTLDEALLWLLFGAVATIGAND